MNVQVQAKWVAALRSGEYTQTNAGCLRDGDSHCCLGVLTALAVADGVDVAADWPDREFLPKAVVVWSGLNEEDPFASDDRASLDTLAERNDGGTSFAELADLIEAQPPEWRG